MTTHNFKFGEHLVVSEIDEDPATSLAVSRRIWSAVQARALQGKKVGTIKVASDGSVTISDPAPVPL